MFKDQQKNECIVLTKTPFKEKRGQLATSSDGRYVLTKPQNTWDTNYHLIDRYTDIDYLIDIENVDFNDYGSYRDDDLEYINIFYSDMLDLDNNIEMVIETSWKSNYI